MNAWDVWYALFPYEDQPDITKERPVIILNIEPLEVLSVKVTHHEIREYDEFDIPIEKWKEAGLIRPSVARVSKTIFLNKNAFTNRIGQLQQEDVKKIYYKYIELVKGNSISAEQSAADKSNE